MKRSLKKIAAFEGGYYRKISLLGTNLLEVLVSREGFGGRIYLKLV